MWVKSLCLAANGGLHRRERGGAAVSRSKGRGAETRFAITRRLHEPKRRWARRARPQSPPWSSKPRQQLKFTDGKTLSSDTTVQEPAIGYPHEPGILKGIAQRIERALKKLSAGGVKAARAGIAQVKEVYRGVKHHHLFAKTKEEKKKILAEIVEQSEALITRTKGVLTARERALRARQRGCRRHLETHGRGRPPLAPADPAVDADGQSRDREDPSHWHHGGPRDHQRQGQSEVRAEVADQSPAGRLSVRTARRRLAPTKPRCRRRP